MTSDFIDRNLNILRENITEEMRSKVLNMNATNLSELEAMKLASNNKINTPRIISFGQDEDVYRLPYIIMDYVTEVGE